VLKIICKNFWASFTRSFLETTDGADRYPFVEPGFDEIWVQVSDDDNDRIAMSLILSEE
jgi:hypothetical protein